jgi:hypothetical protein
MTALDQFAPATPPPLPAATTAPAVHSVDGGHAPQNHRRPGWLRRQLADTPSRLGALSLVSVAAALAFGLLGALGVSTRGTELTSAHRHTEQLVRLQAIRTQLVQADAAATNAFLTGGLEDPAQRRQYVESIDAVATGLTEAAEQANPMDVDELATVNRALVTYTGLVESARANNRQHFPVGASYLRQASDLLRREVQPALTSLSDAEVNRVLDSFDGSASAVNFLMIGLVLALVTFVAGGVWLARKVHRFINVPLGAATAAVAVVAVIALVAMGWAQARADEVRDHSFAAALALAQARVAAFDAKSDESLRLILQGSGAGDTRWKALDAEVVRQLKAATAAGAKSHDDTLAAWRAVHTEIRRLDDGNDWRGAVALATGPGEGSSNEAFAAFAAASQDELQRAVEETGGELPVAANTMAWFAALVLLAGAVAAVAARRGYAQRLAEYR